MFNAKTRRCAALLVLSVLAIASLAAVAGAAEGASARVEMQVIPTFELGDADPQPAIFETRDWYKAYPRSMFLVHTRADEPVDREYEMAVIENPYLRVEVLPDVGGRVWRIIDKATGRNLLWTNDAVKPIRVGRRRGWLAGGIELAFPVGNHGEDTMEPYRWKLAENEDGSVSILVSAFDHFYRFWATYEISLAPDTARMDLTVRFYNPTEVRNRYQYWVNAATKTGDDMQFIMPVEYVAGHGFGGVHDWPTMGKEKDQSFYKNVPGQLGVFGWDAPFVAAYYHDDDWGIVRYASPKYSRGIKMWTWGTKSHWVGEYSLNQGSYNEIQGGRWPVQSMSGWLEPHQMDSWTEHWYPVNGLGGIDAASKDAALSVDLGEDASTAVIRINTLAPVQGNLAVTVGDETLISREVDAAPGQLLTETVDTSTLDEGAVLTVRLTDSQGSSLITFDKPLDGAKGPEPEVPATIEVEGEGEAWERLAAALELELNEGDFVLAAAGYVALTEDEPEFQGAWKALGILRYKQFDNDSALEALSRAAELDASDMEARYYLGLAELQADREGAVETLRGVTDGTRWSHMAKFVLATRDMADGRFAETVEACDEASTGWSSDCIMWDTLAVAARLAGNQARAAAALDAALAADPMDPLALVERLFAAEAADAAAIREALGVDWDLYLEVALFYDGLARPHEAVQVARAGEEFADSGLYYYYLAYLAGRAGDTDAARSYAETAAGTGTDYVFPHRREAVRAFEYVADLTGEIAFPKYYEGVMLYWLGRQDEAVDVWQGLVGRYDVPGLYRIVATAYTRGRLSADMKVAVELYVKAIDEDPDDVDAYAELAELYDDMDDWDALRRTLGDARSRFPENDRIALAMAVQLVDGRDYEEAAEILEAHPFKRAHQSRELRQMASRAITGAYGGLAMEALRDGDREKAMENLEKASDSREMISRWFD